MQTHQHRDTRAESLCSSCASFLTRHLEIESWQWGFFFFRIKILIIHPSSTTNVKKVCIILQIYILEDVQLPLINVHMNRS